jgi:hypothetical protein
MSTLIAGEYDHVSRASADLEALRDAHGTKITRAEASALLAYLCAQHDVEDLETRWSSRCGRASHGPKYQQEKRIAYYRISPTISLNGAPVQEPVYRKRRVYVRDAAGKLAMYIRVSLPKDQTAGYGLRVGVVLHEFAHILNHLRDGGMNRCGHGPLFVGRLDALVAAWRQRTGRIAA